MLAARRAELAARLRVVLIGGLDYEGQNLAEMADKYGAGAVVEVLPALPRREAISYAKGAGCGDRFRPARAAERGVAAGKDV